MSSSTYARSAAAESGTTSRALRHFVAAVALCGVAAVSGTATAAATGTPLAVRDDAGRERQLAAPALRVVAAGGPAEVLLYTLAPERLAAWNREPSPAARQY